MTALTFHRGQLVPLPGSPDGVAQVEECRRRRLSLLYLRGGKLCRRVVSVKTVAAWIAREPLLLSVNNLLRRGVVPQSRTYEVGE